jgi:protein-arginine deiminase
MVRPDFNRDGILDARDDSAARSADGQFSLRNGGAFFLANVDDDDRDGKSDGSDRVVNGAMDEDDLARFEIILSPELQKGVQSVRVDVTQGYGFIHLFAVNEKGFQFFDPVDDVLPAASKLSMALEGWRFAGKDWDGLVNLNVTAVAQNGAEVASQQVEFHVAPWIALPESARTRSVYVAGGAYPNESFFQGLRTVADSVGVQVVQRVTTKWQEMWLQDTFEMGYTTLPRMPPMHVVLNSARGIGIDTFGPWLLAPNLGVVQIAKPRAMGGGDAWADWTGNLSVTHPAPGYPFGRVYYGKNLQTGASFHPEMIAFIDAQKVQSPFWLDTSFLYIKHVDEIVSFVPGGTGQGYMLVASPMEARRYLNLNVNEFAYDAADASDVAIENIMTANINRMKAAIGIADRRIMRMPVIFGDGHSLWSNPVNSLFLNGTVVAGNTRMPAVIQGAVRSKFQSMSAKVFFVDDAMYQNNQGNVHCATNTRRIPVGDDLAALLKGLVQSAVQY